MPRGVPGSLYAANFLPVLIKYVLSDSSSFLAAKYKLSVGTLNTQLTTTKVHKAHSLLLLCFLHSRSTYRHANAATAKGQKALTPYKPTCEKHSSMTEGDKKYIITTNDTHRAIIVNFSLIIHPLKYANPYLHYNL